MMDNYTNFVYSIGVSHTRSTDNHDEMSCIDKKCRHPRVLKWVECEECLKWFNEICVGLKLTNDSAINFVCKKCHN